ncbi:MAG TPA: signal recognition particle-docking protein FtsY, partial [Beijerinckiaceae bacterium]|nr:signal recognition particle-docking protein FtsY [Beijerinckiaceae bacterium]
MAEGNGETKKPGLFGRMFGRKAETAPAPLEREPSGSLEAQQVESRAPVVEREPEGSRASEAPKLSWWKRLKSGLARSSSSIGQGISDVFTKRKLDGAALED